MQYANFSVPSLTLQQKHECLQLASICGATDGHAYLESRFAAYDTLLTAADDSGLAAFQLIQQFWHDGQHYIYFGPLFSRRNAYLPMFLRFFWKLARQTRQDIHLMAEIQNPQVLLIFKTLFYHTSHPLLTQREIPANVQKAAAIFANHLPHIKELDASRLATRSSESLFAEKDGYQPIMDWLHSRSVFYHLGDSQVLLVSLPKRGGKRLVVIADLLRGLYMLGRWRRFKPVMLQRFKEGAYEA